jgi:hypothetical protein
MVHIRPFHAYQSHLSIFPTVTQGLYPGADDVDIKCLYPEGDSWLHASFCCYSLASHMLIRGPESFKSLCPILPTAHETRYGATASVSWATLSEVPISLPVVYIPFYLLRDTCMTSDSPQTPTWSKSSPPIYRRLVSISSIAGWKHLWQDGTNSYMSMVITWIPDIYRLLWMCHLGQYIEVRIRLRH